MKYQACFIFLAVFLLAFSEGSIDPYEKGPHTVGDAIFWKWTNWGLDHDLGVWVPEASGKFPVVYFNVGVAGLIPPGFYSILLSHIASHGFVVVSPFTFTSLPTSEYNAEWMLKVDNWAEDHLLDKIKSEGLYTPGFEIDFSTEFVMGHSSGAHITTNYMKLGCHNIKGMILISPVDGVDPFGLIEDFCITPGEKLPFTTPTLIITAGFDSVNGFDPNNEVIPSCAPEELSNRRFYNALNGEVWMNNATLFGHADFMDPAWVPTILEYLHVCAITTQESTLDYLHMVCGQSVALFKGLLGDCQMFDYLTDTSTMPTEVISVSQGDLSCPIGFCNFDGDV